MNPGGSVKDRAAYGIITDAEQRSLLKRDATIYLPAATVNPHHS